MLFLQKFLPLIASPLGAIIALLLFSLMTGRRWPIHTSLAVLFVSSLPVTSHLMWKNLESTFPPQWLENVPMTDAVVVLSGGLMGQVSTEHGSLSQWHEPADRFFDGIELVKKRRASVIIFTNGVLPWNAGTPEGVILRKHAIAMGIPAEKILVTDRVSNTEDEAREVKVIMDYHGFHAVTLVTSSFHMPRAQFLFRNAGVKVVPYATDYRAKKRLDWTDWVPNARAFWHTSYGLREHMGRVYYLLKYSFQVF